MSRLNSKPAAVPSRIGEQIFCGRRRAGRHGPSSYLCCTSVISNAPRVEQKTKHGWQVLKLPSADFGKTTSRNFEVKSLIDWGKETPPSLINLVRRATNMWSAYLRLLKTHEGEEIKDLETVPGAWAE